jgi:hypothetical protein
MSDGFYTAKVDWPPPDILFMEKTTEPKVKECCVEIREYNPSVGSPGFDLEFDWWDTIAVICNIRFCPFCGKKLEIEE